MRAGDETELEDFGPRPFALGDARRHGTLVQGRRGLEFRRWLLLTTRHMKSGGGGGACCAMTRIEGGESRYPEVAGLTLAALAAAFEWNSAKA